MVDSKKPAREKPIWPIDAPGMPFPGKCFLDAAIALGDDETGSVTTGKGKNKKTQVTIGAGLKRVIRKSLYGYGTFPVPITISPTQIEAKQVVCGHRWASNVVGGEMGPTLGPEPCDVMVIGKMLSDREMQSRRQFVGPFGEKLLEACQLFDIPGYNRWYMTTALKTSDPTGGKKSNIDSFSVQFLHLLHQELRLVRPKFILCLGADALRMLFKNDKDLKDMTLTKAEGRVLEFTYPVHKSHDDPPEYHTCKVMACISPQAVISEPVNQVQFDRTMSRFSRLIQGQDVTKIEEDVKIEVVADEVALERMIKRMRADNPNRLVAIDAEWEGQHPNNTGSYLRCFQVCWNKKEAGVVAFTHPGGAPRFRRIERDQNGRPLTVVKNGKRQFRMTTEGGLARAMKLLSRGLKDRRIVGFFTLSDLEWCQYYGLDLRQAFDAPEDWRKCRTQGGLSTELMAHACDEGDRFELNAQILKWTDVPRYDIELEDWIKSYKDRRIKEGLSPLDGYGEVPDEVLYPYAAWDVIATRRLCLVHIKRLDSDQFGNNCWRSFHADQRAMLPVLEINTGGLLVDRERMDELTAIFLDKRDQLRADIRKYFNWEETDGQDPLNLESPYHVREVLFGHRLNGMRDENGEPIRLRPQNAVSLGIMPVLTTGKRPLPWAEVVEAGKEGEETPSTSKTVLGILLHEAKTLQCWNDELCQYETKDYEHPIALIRDYRFMNQVLKTVLRPPKTDEATKEYMQDEDGNWVYERGMGSSICSDGYIRTYISLLLETGRWSSSRPNLQNLGKRRDADYERILGGAYKYSIRSILKADPGCVLIEADYIGAELYGMAILAQDETMIDHCLRNQLDEDDPNFYDIHSNVAVLAFKLECEPTKRALKAIKKDNLRIVAKSVIFGLAYGRGAKAIAMAAREEGISITTREAQAVIDTILHMYPKLEPLFEECRRRAANQFEGNSKWVKGEQAPRWLCNSFFRYRRFPWTSDRKLCADFEREAMNFPIQSLIADVVDRAIRKIYDRRNETGMKFRIALQIHDALLFCVPYAEVDRFMSDILPNSMKGIRIIPRNLDGSKMENPTRPYYTLGIDTEVSENWGEALTPEWLEERKIPVKYGHWTKDETLGGYRSSKKKDKFWKDGQWVSLKKDEPKVSVHDYTIGAKA